MIDGKDYNEQEINKGDGIDWQIKTLVDLINKVDGIETTNSCFGHYKRPCSIYCRARNIEVLNKFIYNYFYRNDLWIFRLLLSDITIDNKDWDKIDFVLESRFYDYPTVNLMIENLVYTMKKEMKYDK